MSITLNNNYNVVSTMGFEDKSPKMYQVENETTRFDHELLQKKASTPITKEELFQQWDENIKANQDKKMTIYEMLSARPFAKELMYSMVGSSKVYTFDEYVEEVKKMIKELNDK